MRKTRILAIAPYEGLREVLTNEAEAFSDQIEVTAYLGDLSAGLDVAHSLSGSGYDVILSRGGTAELLEKNLSLPVVDVVPSVLDVLRFVRLARNTPCRHAIVAFPAIADIAGKLFDLLQQKEVICTIHNEREAETVIEQLKAEGYSLVLGDAIAVTTAQRFNLNAILIASGAESVHAAFTEAIRLRQLTERMESDNLLFRSILDASALNVIVFNAKQEFVWSNLSADQMDYPRVFRTISSCVPAVLEQGEIRLVRKSKGFMWDITGRRASQPTGDLAVFYVEKRLSPPQQKNGVVEFYHMLSENAPPAEEGPIDTFGAMQQPRRAAEKLAETLSPVLVTGERGTPVDDILRVLCQYGPWKMHTLMTVDCALIDEKSFEWLLECEDSLLCTNKLNICMKNLDALSEPMTHRFADFAHSTALHKRNHVLYSAQGALKEAAAAFLDAENCAVLRLPTLRERREDISGLASLYLGALNTELGRQAIGFSPEALRLLEGFAWPGNQSQLRRVIRQALLSCEDEILSEQAVAAALHGAPEEAAVSTETPWLEGTLDEITRRAVQSVLAQEGMNKSRAAERLGISRTTLWRMLR